VNTPDAVDAIRPSVVQVVFSAEGIPDDVATRVGGPTLNRPIGTGFLLNEDAYVVTAKHVVDGARRLASETRAATSRLQVAESLSVTSGPPVAMRGVFTSTGADVVDEDERHDVALLKLGQNPFAGELRSLIAFQDQAIPVPCKAASSHADRPRDGESVGISGYPLGQPVLITSTGVVASGWVTDVQRIQVPGIVMFSLDLADVYWVDATVNPGNSGGPVYLIEDASVVGMCVATRLVPVVPNVHVEGQPLSYSAGMTVVVPVPYIAAIAEKNGTSWPGKDPKVDTDSISGPN
jgi:S1-C subfamily serine protease